MTVLALDLGTTTGFALGTAGVMVSGTETFKNDRFSGGGMRFLRFRRWLDELHAASPVSEIVFEEVRSHKGTDAAHVYGGLMGMLTAWCEEQVPPIPYQGIPVQAIKKSFTGKGNANKALMILCCRKLGHQPADDNEADAIALLYYRMGERALS